MAKQTKQYKCKLIHVSDATPEMYDITYWDNKIEQYILDYINNPINEIIDIPLSKISQQQWDGLLHCIGRDVFNYGRLIPRVNGATAFDIDFIEIITNIYLLLCQRYNKTTSIISFCFFLGIDNTSLYDWINNSNNININNRELNHKRAKIIKRITENREHTLKNKLESTSQAVGFIAIGNQEFGWSGDTVANEERARTMALSDLPTLNGIDKLSQNDTQFIPQIDDI